MSKLLPIKPDYSLMLEGTREEKEEIKGFESEYNDFEEERDDSAKEDDIVIEYANLENKKAQERESGEKVPTEETKSEEMKESENEKKADDVVDTKGTDTANNDKKDIAIDVVAEKAMVNGTETNKKSAKKKGNKKNHEEPEKKRVEEKVAPPTIAEAREFHGSKKVPESKQTEAATTGKEVVLSEVKIWKRLDALRAIVGYKASPHRTYIGELKALYMFTGVDLPTSFKDSSDLVEFNDKLGFLMSIVGVK